MNLLTPRILRGGALALCLICTRLAGAEPAGPRYFPVQSMGGTAMPFSEAVQLGETLFVSGQVGNLPGSLTIVSGGIEAEARQVMENLKAILQRHGSSLDHVVKCTVFLTDIKEWPAFNAVYRGYFKTHFPARSALAASGLALGARVEVECIAWVPPAANGAGESSRGK